MPRRARQEDREIVLERFPRKSANAFKKLKMQRKRKLWMADVTRPDGTNMCTHFTMFPTGRRSGRAEQVLEGLNLDGDEGDGSSNPAGCAPELRITRWREGHRQPGLSRFGLQPRMRGVDGNAGDQVPGSRAS